MLLYLNYVRTPKYYQIALEVFGLQENFSILSDCLEIPVAVIDDHQMPWFERYLDYKRTSKYYQITLEVFGLQENF